MGQKESLHENVEKLLWNVILPIPSILRELPFLLTRGIYVYVEDNILTFVVDRAQGEAGLLTLHMVRKYEMVEAESRLGIFFPLTLTSLIFEYILKWRCSFTDLSQKELLRLHSHIVVHQENEAEILEAMQCFSAMRKLLLKLHIRRIEIGKHLEWRRCVDGYDVNLHLSEQSQNATFFIGGERDYKFHTAPGTCWRPIRRNEFILVSHMTRKFLSRGMILFSTAKT